MIMHGSKTGRGCLCMALKQVEHPYNQENDYYAQPYKQTEVYVEMHNKQMKNYYKQVEDYYEQHYETGKQPMDSLINRLDDDSPASRSPCLSKPQGR